MNCLIVDDSKISRLALQQLLTLDPSLKIIGEFDNATDAYNKIIAFNKIDLLLLDIEMPGISGIDLAKSLSQKQVMIIFITAKRDYAVEAFDLNVVDFITKPISPARFLKSIEKAKEVLKNKKNKYVQPVSEFIFIRDSNTVRRIKLDEILFLEAKGDYVNININDKVYTIHSSLKSVEDKLPNHIFLRVHRSYLININKIDIIEGNTLLIDKNFIPISDAYKASLIKKLQIL